MSPLAFCHSLSQILRITSLLWLGGLIFFDAVASAQIRHPSDRPLNMPSLEQRQPELITPPASPTPKETSQRLSTGQSVFIRTVHVEGNTAVSAAALAPITARFEGRTLATEDFEALRLALTRAYVERGYINSGAVLPDQNIAEGVVQYRIVEGRLTSIELSGNKRTRGFHLRNQIWREVENPLNLRDLRRAIQLLLQDPVVKTVNASLSPGLNPGDATLLIAVEEHQPLSLTVTADNSGSPSSSSKRGKASITLLNIVGFGERLYLDIDPGKGATLKSTVPITPWGTELSLSYEVAQSRVIEQPFNLIDLETDFAAWRVGLDHPVYRDSEWRVSLGVNLERRRSVTTIFERRFSLEDGAEEGHSVVTAGRLIQDVLYRDREQVFAFRSSFTKGLNALGANWSRDPDLPSSNFFAWLAQAQYVRRLDIASADLVLRTEMQLTDDRLLGLEKYSVGGLDSVRGYRTNQLVRDNGYAASIELRAPLGKIRIPQISVSEQDGLVQIAPYIDYGEAWDNRIVRTGVRRIYGLGVGLRWQASPRLSASLYWSAAHKNVTKPLDEDLTDRGVYFRIATKLY